MTLTLCVSVFLVVRQGLRTSQSFHEKMKVRFDLDLFVWYLHDIF